MTSSPDISGAANEAKEVAHQLKLEMARRGFTRYDIESRTKLSKSTIEKALSGLYSEFTLIKIKQALEDADDDEDHEAPVAGEDYGAYTRASVAHYEGEYICFRPAFARPDNIYAYKIDIAWNADKRRLTFKEKNRNDATYQNTGSIYIPQGSMYMSLLTIEKGRVRQIIVSQLDPSGSMRGIITTLHNPRGNIYIPTSSPIILTRNENDKNFVIGEIDNKSNFYPIYREMLDQTIQQEYAKLMT